MTMTVASQNAIQNNIQPATSWDFAEALDLLAAWEPFTPQACEPSKNSRSPSPLDKAHLYDPKSSKSSGLGDLNRLFDFLGKGDDGCLDHTRGRAPSVSSLSSAADKSTPPSSFPEDRPAIGELIAKSKEVRWTDEVEGSNLDSMGRSRTWSSNAIVGTGLRSLTEDSDFETSTPSKIYKSRRKSRAHLLGLADDSDPGLESQKPRSVRQRSKHHIEKDEASDEDATPRPSINTTPIPALVTSLKTPAPAFSLWAPPPIPNSYFDPHLIQPIDFLTRREKYTKLTKKLKKRYRNEADITRMDPEQAAGVFGGNIKPGGLHVFVDCSNIVIGFLEQLKRKRGMKEHAPARGGVLSWHALAHILERGRPVARRILVGSRSSRSDTQPPKRPEHMVEAEKCGYEVNLLERVTKAKDATPNKKRRGQGNGYATASGYSSGSDGTYMSRKAVIEQGVDEILHMKLLESLIDTEEPSTIVLASGDAAEAEYSGGFLKNVERALRIGWKVELVSWSAGLSHDYQSTQFLEKWKGRFSIVVLDDYSEEMLAIYFNTLKPSRHG